MVRISRAAIPRRRVGRPRKTKTRRHGIWRGALSAPSKHTFVRTAGYSNIANTSIDGDGFVTKGTAALQLNLGALGAIQYGAGSMYFTLDSLPDYGEFTTLFDSYRIEKVKIKFTPFFGMSLTASAVSATSAQATVLWHDIIDFDDATVPTNTETGLGELRQYKSYRTQNVTTGRSFTRTLRPRAAMPAYAAGAFNAYTRAPLNTWYDCVNANIQFYGYKFIVEVNNPGSASIFYVKTEVKIKFSTRDVR